MKLKNVIFFLYFIFSLSFSLFSLPFNSKLTESEIEQLNNGQIVIKNINDSKHISLNKEINPLCDQLINSICTLNPKYLAEVIKIIPYKGNEKINEKLEVLLRNVPDYAGIPYWSERCQEYFPLYSSSEILENKTEGNKEIIMADLLMEPFGHVQQNIIMYKEIDTILYFSENLNTLKYYDDFKCVSPNKMNMDVLLFRDGDNWILYGIGGVNAPKIPFFSERIETSFINRIKTFCNFVFTKLDE